MARFGRLGWFFGLIFGTLFGVLFAPRKGAELRSKIKSERKRGKLGFAPLQDDMKRLGQEIADIARELYSSKAVQELVVTGRKRLKELSDDFVEDVSDFHITRIRPIENAAREKARLVRGELKRGKKKLNTSAKIGKKAVKEIKKEWKKE